MSRGITIDEAIGNLEYYMNNQLDKDIEQLNIEGKRWLDENMDYCIMRFYNDYSPKYYNRTNSLFGIHSSQIVGGEIRQSWGDSNISDIGPYKQSNDVVWDIVGHQGEHGGIGLITGRYSPKPCNPTPMEMMQEVEDEWINYIMPGLVDDFFDRLKTGIGL